MPPFIPDQNLNIEKEFGKTDFERNNAMCELAIATAAKVRVDFKITRYAGSTG